LLIQQVCLQYLLELTDGKALLKTKINKMKSFFLKVIIGGIAILALPTFINAQNKKLQKATIIVELNKSLHTVSPDLFGVFFEDINHSSDGGIYPELVRNTSFEDADTLQHWKFNSKNGTSTATVTRPDIYAKDWTPAINVFNRKMLSIKADGIFMLENDGYWGMNIEKDHSYIFSVAAISKAGFDAPLKISIVSSSGITLAAGEVSGFGDAWKYHTINLTSSGSDANAHLVITGEGKGNLYLDMVSLKPTQTWKNHGLRTDLAEAVNALQPAFYRFPGGCWVEGDDFQHMYNWKNTISNIDSRTPLWNIWGYNATQGLGYHEYLQMAEDMNAEPLFCINAGMSHKEIVPLEKMGQWVQDALDAIEYANGDTTTIWGKVRIRNGHPNPFNLKFLEIGNENGGDAYAERWSLITKAIHAKYPNIKLIANDWGNYPKDPMPEIKDEHYYNVPDWFIWNANKYDSYDRNGPKIFVGEYAVTAETGKGNLRGAIGEAAWMTGMERNSDVVIMAAYAPLLCNANHRAWPINLINFDSRSWYGLPSYYVQKMFAENQGTHTLAVTIKESPTIKAPNAEGYIGLGTWNNSAEFKDLKVVSPAGKILYQNNFTKNIDDWEIKGGDWSVKDGILCQTAFAANTTAFVGDKSWKDYSIFVKARKISGDNGIQIYFRNRNKDERIRWEMGGNMNAAFVMQNGITNENLPGSIEANRWYDIKVEVKGTRVKAFVDGKLIQDVNDNNFNLNAINTSAVKDERSGDIILKIVNAAATAVETEINLTGSENISDSGTLTVLTSGSALDENNLEEPTKVYPKEEKITFSGNKIIRSFPGNSLTVLRLKTKN
jgi:alpha-L-arabinofuranosidase